MPVVRISRGHFGPEQFEDVKTTLDEGAETLIPAIKKLAGLLHYYVGIDAKTNTMVNVSVWESEEDAEQMSSLAEMLAQRDIFVAKGVQFDKIANYQPLWDITP